jgi:hypothetical protein
MLVIAVNFIPEKIWRDRYMVRGDGQSTPFTFLWTVKPGKKRPGGKPLGPDTASVETGDRESSLHRASPRHARCPSLLKDAELYVRNDGWEGILSAFRIISGSNLVRLPSGFAILLPPPRPETALGESSLIRLVCALSRSGDLLSLPFGVFSLRGLP